MESNFTFLIEFLLFAVAALGWGAWEIWSVRSSRTAPPDAQASKTRDSSEQLPRHPKR
jgi:hypothetical protein